jgi:hypothetical protein
VAAVTFFLATSFTQKQLSRDDLLSCVRDLLQERLLQLPAAILQGTAANEVRGERYRAAAKARTLLRASDWIIPNEPIAMLRLARDLAQTPEQE